MSTYYSQAESDAWDTIQEFTDEILEQVERGETVSDDLYDYSNGDEYHNQTHIDKEYSLSEAAELLDNLDRWEEEDSGLWTGLEPRKAICAQAAFTYGNCVLSLWRDYIADLNEEIDAVEPEGSEGFVRSAKVRWAKVWLWSNTEEFATTDLKAVWAAVVAGCAAGSVTELLLFADALEEAGRTEDAKEFRQIAAYRSDEEVAEMEEEQDTLA